jgi:hypothetical protein
MNSDMNLPLRVITVFIFLSLMAGCGDNSLPTSTGDSDSPPDQHVDPPEFMAEFQSESTEFSPGSIEYIVVDGPDLSHIQIKSEINGEAAELVTDTEEDQNRLIMLVPPLPPGEHLLQIKLDEDVIELEFSVINYQSIEDPDEFVEEYIQDLINSLEEIISTLELDKEIDLVSDKLDKLEDFSDELHSLSVSDIKSIAYILNHYLPMAEVPEFSLMAGMRSNLRESCDDYSLDFTRQSAKLYDGISFIVLAGAANAIPGVGTAAGIMLAGVGVAHLIDAVRELLNKYDEALNACFSDPTNDLSREFNQFNSLQAYQSDGQVEFIHNESQLFYIESTYSLQNQFIEALVQLREAITSLAEHLPERWTNRFINIPENHTELSPPSRFTVQNISDSDIEIQSETSGDQLSLTASFKDGRMAEETRSFNFEIKDQEYPSSIIQVDAGLVPVTLPVVYDMQKEVISGEAVVFTLHSENADYIEIIDQPNHGSLNVLDPATGEVEYTSVQNYIGEDSFTFRAVNEDGTSNIATVSVSVVELAIIISNLRFEPDYNPEPHICCAFVYLYVDFEASGITIDEEANPGHFNLSYNFSPEYFWTTINPYSTWWRHGTPELGTIQWGLSIHRARELSDGEIETTNSVTIHISYTYGGVTSNTITRTISL